MNSNVGSEWISVGDRLPEDGRSVHYKTSDGQAFEGRYFDSAVGFVQATVANPIGHEEVTHWKYPQ